MAISKTAAQVREWVTRIDNALLWQGTGGRLAKWREARDWYHNRYPAGVVSVNLIFAIGRALVPQLYFKSPTILVVPRQRGLDRAAKILEAIDAVLMQQMGVKQQIKLGIIDAFLTNTAVFKFGYNSVGTELPRRGAMMDAELAGLGPDVQGALRDAFDLMRPGESDEVMGAVGAGGEGEEAPDADDTSEYSHHDWISPDTPWMLRTAPEDFLVPAGTTDLASAAWCAFRVVRPLEEVLKDPVYTGNVEGLSSNATLGIQGVETPTITDKYGRPMASGEDNAEHVELWEIWDKRTGRVIAVVDGHDQFLRNDEHHLPVDGLPVELLQFNPVGWDFWGEADVQHVVQQIRELNETRTLELRSKRAAITKAIVQGGAFDPTELAKMARGESVIVQTNGVNPVGAVVPFSLPTNNSLFEIEEKIRTDIREILGFSRNQAGEFEASRRTATEASIIQQNIQLRSDERRDQVADLLANSFQRKIHPMLFSLWDTQRVIKVTGQEGWVSFVGTDLRGDYLVQTIPDSVVPLSRMQRKAEAIQLFQVFRNDPRVRQERLYDMVVDAFEGVVPHDLLLTQEELLAMQKAAAMQQAMMGRAGQPQGQPPQPRNGNGAARPPQTANA